MIKEFRFSTKKDDVFCLTGYVEEAIEESQIQEGMCMVHIPHTTAGLCLTSKWDETDFADIKG